jgi:hypothetical protein
MSGATIYVTYGYGSNQRHNYSVVHGVNEEECYRTIWEVTEGRYAFTYKPEYFDGQPEQYGLTEIPLQAQEMPDDTQVS